MKNLAKTAFISTLFVVLLHLHGGISTAATTVENQQRIGHLLHGSRQIPINEIYDPASGRVLLTPGVPLPPPTPKEGAIRIGIIDSGVLAGHPQLRTLVVAEKAFAGADPADRIGHGTLTALQIIAGYVDTMSQASIDNFSYPEFVSARVTDDSGAIPSVETVIAAIEWAIAEGSRYVNLSLVFRGEASEYTDLCQAVARHSDIIFVAAAGNFGPEVETFPAACSENILSVGEAHDSTATQHSGIGDVYAQPADYPLLTLWQYHIELGKQAALANNYILARQEFSASLDAKRNAEALFRISLLDILEKKLVSATERLNAALELEPQNSILYSHLGTVRYLQRRFDDAEALLREALRLNVTEPRAHFNLGQTLLALGRPSEALIIFERLRKLNPDYPRLNSAIARAAARLNANSQEGRNDEELD